jgi:hypothetical protein
VGRKKTALLQTLVLCRLVRFANVLFCASAVHYIDFLFLSLCSKLSAVYVALTLGNNGGGIKSKRIASYTIFPMQGNWYG